jgi:thioredoxin reductase (NADPH)
MFEKTTRVLIIGAGPAGLTAAIYAARAELKPIVMEGSPGRTPGGQLMITTDVENYPGFPDGIMGPEVIEKFRSQAERFGTELHQLDVLSVDVTARPFRCEVGWAGLTEGEEDDVEGVVLADTVVIATGADAKWLGLEDEKRLQNHGVSACATCDGAFFRGMEVAVVGGGDTAMEEAMFLTRMCTRVHVIHRREELRASKIMGARAQANEKIEFHWNTQLKGISGTAESGVTGVTLQSTVGGADEEIPLSAVFIAIGHKPNSDLWTGILDMNDAGYLVTQPDSTYTNVPGIFACGDVQDDIYRQAVTAAGSGCAAAIDAERWLEEVESTVG